MTNLPVSGRTNDQNPNGSPCHPATTTKSLSQKSAIYRKSFTLPALKERYPKHEMILHSDQGAVYASKKFNELLPMYSILRSMSRAGTPTDNAAMEAINGWIKAELFADSHVTGERDVAIEVDEYIVFFNEQRPAYSFDYLTPRQYRERYAPTIIC